MPTPVLGFALGRKVRPDGALKLAAVPVPSAYGEDTQPTENVFCVQLKPTNVATVNVSTAMERMALLFMSATYKVLTPLKATPIGPLNAAAVPVPST